jgi:hypothetical protein
MALNDQKIRKLNITNMNPMEITIETITKTQIDDLTVFVERIVDKTGKVVFQQT